MSLADIITSEDQALIENTVIEICFTMRLLMFFVPFVPEFLDQRLGGLEMAVDRTDQGM